MSIQRKLARCFQCNCQLNRRVILLKRAWDEVSFLLLTAKRHCGCCCSGKRHRR